MRCRAYCAERNYCETPVRHSKLIFFTKFTEDRNTLVIVWVTCDPQYIKITICTLKLSVKIEPICLFSCVLLHQLQIHQSVSISNFPSRKLHLRRSPPKHTFNYYLCIFIIVRSPYLTAIFQMGSDWPDFFCNGKTVSVKNFDHAKHLISFCLTCYSVSHLGYNYT